MNMALIAVLCTFSGAIAGAWWTNRMHRQADRPKAEVIDMAARLNKALSEEVQELQRLRSVDQATIGQLSGRLMATAPSVTAAPAPKLQLTGDDDNHKNEPRPTVPPTRLDN